MVIKTVKPRFLKKKRPARKTGFTKAVAKIAKAAVKKTEETKSAYNSISSTNVFDGLVYARNLLYFMAQGTGSEQYIGEKMWLKNIHIKGHMSLTWTNAVSTERNKTYRFLVIRANQAFTTTSTAVTYSDIFRSGSSNSALPSTCLHTDNHKITVLYDSGAKVVQKAYKENVPIVPIDINIVIDKPVVWTADGSGYIKNGNYYLVYMAEDQSAANIATVAWDFTVNYKDS